MVLRLRDGEAVVVTATAKTTRSGKAGRWDWIAREECKVAAVRCSAEQRWAGRKVVAGKKELRLIVRRRPKDEMPREDAYDTRTSIARGGVENARSCG